MKLFWFRDRAFLLRVLFYWKNCGIGESAADSDLFGINVFILDWLVLGIFDTNLFPLPIDNLLSYEFEEFLLSCPLLSPLLVSDDFSSGIS